MCINVFRRKEISEVVEHFLEKNDFHPFPEMPISAGNVFFPKSKSHLQNRRKMFQKSFHENHFWVPSKSFSCVKNHFRTGRKWFFAPVNHFFASKQREIIFSGSKSFQKNHFQMEMISKKVISKWKSFTYHMTFSKNDAIFEKWSQKRIWSQMALLSNSPAGKLISGFGRNIQLEVVFLQFS